MYYITIKNIVDGIVHDSIKLRKYTLQRLLVRRYIKNLASKWYRYLCYDLGKIRNIAVEYHGDIYIHNCFHSKRNGYMDSYIVWHKDMATHYDIRCIYKAVSREVMAYVTDTDKRLTESEKSKDI